MEILSGLTYFDGAGARCGRARFAASSPPAASGAVHPTAYRVRSDTAVPAWLCIRMS